MVVFLAGSDSSRTAGMRGDDLEDMFIPRAAWLAEALQAGRLPDWNPEVGCGIDQFVTLQSAVWYPPMWLYAALPVSVAMGWLAFGHLLLASGGLYAWLRAIDVSRLGALLAAGGLAFGAVGESRWPTMLYTIAWIPWQFYLLDRPGRFGAWRWIALSLTFAFQFVIGYPQLVVYGAMLFFAYALVRTARERSIRLMLLPISAAAVGALVAAVQLVPSLHYMQNEAWRQGRLSPADVHYMTGVPDASLPRQWMRMLPKAIENDQKDRTLSDRFSFGYLGAIMPVAVIAAILCGLSWRVIFFLCAALAGLYLSLGYSPTPIPIYDWLSRLPVLGSFRTPDRFLLWYLLGCSVLLGIGVDRLLATGARSSITRVLVGVMLVAAVGRVGLCAVRGDPWPNPAIFVSTMVVLAFVVVRQSKIGVPSRCGAVAIFALCMADLWIASGFMCPYIDFPHENFDRIHTRKEIVMDRASLAALAERAGHDRIYIAEAYRPVMRTGHLPAFRTLPMYESLMPTRHFQLCNAAFPAEKARYRHFGLWNIPPIPHARIFDWCSVRYLASTTALPTAESDGWRRVETPHDAPLAVYENQRARPRAVLTEHFEVMDPNRLLELLPTPLAADESGIVFLEQAPSADFPSSAPGSASAASIGQIRWVTDDPARVTLDVTCVRPAFLVLSDSYAPGWTATINGRPAQILRANFLHRAVELPAGRHTVEFRYQTPRLATGAALSAAGIALWLAVAAFTALRKRRVIPTD